MRKRTQGRESALKVMYQKEMTGEQADEALRHFFESQPKMDKEMRAFIEKIVVGVQESSASLDKRVETVAENWSMKRMAVLDRNILRMAVYEMTEMTETPVKVVINEAVNLAKKYSGENSGKFVNGIHDKLMHGNHSDSALKAQPPILPA